MGAINLWRRRKASGCVVVIAAIAAVVLSQLTQAAGASVTADEAAIAPTVNHSEIILLAQANPSLDQLQQQRREIEKKRSTLNQEQNRLQNLENQAEQRLDGLETDIQATQAQISDTEAKLAEAEQKLTQLEAKLAKAEAEYVEMQTATVARLQFLQRQSDSQGWAVLLKSQNFNDFLDRRHQLKRVYAADRNVLVALKQKTDEIIEQRRGVETQKNQVALVRQQLLAQKQEYETQATQQASLIERLKQDQAALEAAEAQLSRDSEQLAALIRQRISVQGGNVQGTGQMIYPISARMTSGFGTRVHPVLGYRRFHAGIDFGAPTGAAIRAADSGRVIFAGWYGGYGRAVIIDHGSGITTLYAHSSQLYVREGQAVQQGQPIAAVGSTGLSTGPHLHFEVRRNGSPVNPLSFL